MKYILLLLAFVSSLTFAQVSNTTVTPLTSTAQTATSVTSGDFGNFGYRGAHFIVNVTTFTSGTYTPKIQGKDPVTGTYYDILVGPAISATGATILKIYPGISTIANGAASDVLPQTWRVVLTGASTPNMVLSVVANLEI